MEKKIGFLKKMKQFLSSSNNDKTSCCDNSVSEECSSQDKECNSSAKGKYKCQICGRMIHEEHSLEHAKAEEYLINLIRKDHSHWQDKEPTCEECVVYYRKLVDKTEI